MIIFDKFPALKIVDNQIDVMGKVIWQITKFSYICLNQVRHRVKQCKSVVGYSVYLNWGQSITGWYTAEYEKGSFSSLSARTGDGLQIVLFSAPNSAFAASSPARRCGRWKRLQEHGCTLGDSGVHGRLNEAVSYARTVVRRSFPLFWGRWVRRLPDPFQIPCGTIYC